DAQREGGLMPAETPLSRVLARLQDVRRSGNGYSARCPAHHDERASLALTDDEQGNVVLYCHAQCDTADVMAAVGLTMAGLFADGRQRDGHARATATETCYRLVDADGRLVAEHVRLDTPNGKRM